MISRYPRFPPCDVPVGDVEAQRLAHDQQQEHVLSQPARRQIETDRCIPYAYTEGQETYNIWYHKFCSNSEFRAMHEVRDPSDTRCSPLTDSGYTRADRNNTHDQPYFCVYFAKGCCSKGEECEYRHRLPTEDDEFQLDASKDIFGRDRFGTHRDDMGGVGVFTQDCRTLYIGRIKRDGTQADATEHLQRVLLSEFKQWGPVECLRVIARKGLAFVTFTHRVNAEFAKVAMADQTLGRCGITINIRWAHELTPEQKSRNAELNAKQADKGRDTGFETAAATEGSKALEYHAITGNDDYLSMYFAALQAEQKHGNGPITYEQLCHQNEQMTVQDNIMRMNTILNRIEPTV